MPIPHDYYDIHGMPRLHNVGEGRPYLENDYHANDHGPQVPSLSTIGRGPRGEGLRVGNVVNGNGTVSFALYSDLTDELVWQSPNLDPGTLDFYLADFRDLTAGQPAPMDIVHTRGGVTKTTTAYLPCGERGSLVFLLGGRSVPRVPSDTYQTTAEELMIYGHRVWPNDNKPLPHVNDIVFFRYTDGDETGFAFGTIETVGTRNNEKTIPTTPIVYTARVFVPCTGGEGGGCDCEPGYEVKKTQLLSETVTTSESDGCYYNVLTSKTAINSDTIIVTFDGVDYECSNISEFNSVWQYGAPWSESLGGYDFSVFPFSLNSFTDGSSGEIVNDICTETAGTYDISVNEVTVEPSEYFAIAVNECIDLSKHSLYDLEIRFNSVRLLEGAFINYGSYESFFNKLRQGRPINVKVDQLNINDHVWYREYDVLHIAADNYYNEDIEILIVNTDEHKYYLLTVTESNEVTVTEVERPI